MKLNEYLMGSRNINDHDVMHDWSFPIASRITCKDGFSLSVQASHGAYCQPRHNVGPWHQVEVGFPSSKPELIMSYCEQPERPTQTVYGYVPIELVEDLIAMHGGMQDQLRLTYQPPLLSWEGSVQEA